MENTAKNQRSRSARKNTERTWLETLQLLETTHTTSVKRGCKALKCSRTWFTKYILPWLEEDAIYLAGRGSSGANWAQGAALQLGRVGELTESIWLNTAAFDHLVRSSVTSATQQTKLIPLINFVPESQVGEFEELYDAMEEARKNGIYDGAKPRYLIIFEELKERYLPPEVLKFLKENEASPNARGRVPRVDVPLPRVPIEEWMAVHDLKDYGDTDEVIYRRLFSAATVRLRLQIPLKGSTEEASEKIFYVDDPEPIRAVSMHTPFALVSYAAYIASNIPQLIRR